MLFNFRHYFFPQESNNFRPKTLHSSALVFYITILVTLQISFNLLSFIKPGVLGYATDISVDRLLELTNQKRSENGLNLLTLDPQLSQAAFAKANDMFTNNYWAHNSPLGRSPWDFILEAGYHYVYAGENLAKDFADSDGVVSAWMASPTHRDNLVSPKYQNIGFAVVNGKLNGLETTLIVQMFGTKAPQAQINLSEKEQTIIPTAIPTVIITNEKPGITPMVFLEITPTAEPAITAVPTNKPVDILIANLKNSSVKNNPKINIFSLTKEISLILALLLITVLIIDGYIAFKDKQVRISGDNIAHIAFIGILIIAILVTSVGMIM